MTNNLNTGKNATSGSSGQGQAPCTMQMAVARLRLPAIFLGATFWAAVDLDTATATVNLTTTASVRLSVSLRVSPVAPVLWSTITSTAAVTGLALNTTVVDRFFFKGNSDASENLPLPTTASCSGPTSATVSRGTEPAAVLAQGTGVTGAIHHSIRQGTPRGSETAVEMNGAGSCQTQGNTSTELRFDLAAGVATTIATVVRVSRDPGCVARPKVGAAPLCGLGTDPVAAAAAIQADLSGITVAESLAHHQAHWDKFWNASTISLPQAPETEAFWFGSQYIANSAMPHEGQELTPPGLYGPWGTVDSPGWHGDYSE